MSYVQATAASETPSGDHAEALALLASIVRGEPRLTLSRDEAHDAADLIATWLHRGATDAQIANAVTHALPTELRFPGRLVLARLRDRMPLPPTAPPAARFACIDCGDPLSQPGTCRPCLFGGQSLRLEQDRAIRRCPGKGEVAYNAARATLRRATTTPSLPCPTHLGPLPDNAAV